MTRLATPADAGVFRRRVDAVFVAAGLAVLLAGMVVVGDDGGLPGWEADITGVRSWTDLPKEAQAYLARIAEISGVPVCQVSVGPEREQVVDV